MASAYLGAGAAQGAAAIPENVLRLKEARARQQLSEQKLADYRAAEPLRESQQVVEMQKLQNELYRTQAEGLKQQTYNAFNAFEGDGNVKHLNNFLTQAKRNPIGRNMFSDAVRYDEVTRTPETEQMLRRIGINDIDGYFENPREAGNFVLSTTASGQKQLLDFDKVYAATGYTQFMQDQQLERMNKRSLIVRRLMQGETKVGSTALERVAQQKAEAEGIPFHQAYEELKKGSVKQASTENERLAQSLMEQDPNLSYVDAMEQAIKMKKTGSALEREAQRISEASGRDYNEVFEELKVQEERTTAQKSFEEIEKVKDDLDSQFKGDFLSADLSDPKIRAKVGRQIARIEKDFPLSPKERALITELRQLTSLGGVAGEELSDAEAGPLDSMFRDVKKYISNEVGGTVGTSAYEAFRNTMRHALFGATQSVGEMKSFQKAAGSLTEQLGPVLSKFRTQIKELQVKLQSIYDLNDDYVAKFHLNMDRDKIAKVITALDERLETIDDIKPAKGQRTLTPGEKKPVAEYFKR